MSKLKIPLTPTQVAKKKLADIRRDYNSLAKEYDRIVNRRVIYCPFCGEWKPAETNFYK